MNESDRTPGVHLDIQQEVFLDVVRDGDVIEDATVATEVTSFERIGDAYVLEGAIVFAGYIQRGEADEGLPEQEMDDILGFGIADGSVEHVHHRMPFTFRVPVSGQPRSVMNVTSRIARWKLEVVGTGWVRVVADLAIFGLNAEEGYHFQCGAQEEGDAWFGQAPHLDAGADADWVDSPQTRVANEPSEVPDSASANETQNQSAEEEFELVRGPGQSDDAADAISWARGGADAQAPQPEGQGEPKSLSGELKHYDRALAGKDGESQPQVHAEAEPGQEGVREAASEPWDARTQREEEGDAASGLEPPPARESAREDGTAIAEYEFEHQLSADEMKRPPAAVAESGLLDTVRDFTDEGLTAPIGLGPQIRYGSRPDDNSPRGAGDGRAAAAADSVSKESVPSDGAVTESDAAWDEAQDKSGVSHMWSFVDFSAPERTYTMRFAIVLEEESVDDLAERLGCSRQELLRINRLSSGTTLYAGQTLLIPSR
ncbi:LysM peptidoglycan-binding domain-containing protein [Alicyclobacillus kakegawensis]|uniref:LysM peptidoglycan-binding domain-containing protein n=1 Tax=Alicyclobacillus kakegawensis TaxID=392012 RepID=UPI0008370F77|nr:LysM peptidoglycan-binding domain-containing protein [Alicyclobacillus kakegawensis]